MVPVGSVTVTVLPGYGRAPVDDVVKPTVQSVVALTAVEDGATERLETAWAAVRVTDLVAVLVSADVDTVVVADPVVVGLVTSLSTTESTSPTFTE